MYWNWLIDKKELYKKFYFNLIGLLTKRSTCLYATRDRLKFVNEILTKVCYMVFFFYLVELFSVTSTFKRDVYLVGVREVLSNYSPSGTYILRLLSLAPNWIKKKIRSYKFLGPFSSWKEQGFEILSKSIMKFFKGIGNIPFMKSLHQSWDLDSTPELPIFYKSENQLNIIFSFTVKI